MQAGGQKGRGQQAAGTAGSAGFSLTRSATHIAQGCPLGRGVCSIPCTVTRQTIPTSFESRHGRGWVKAAPGTAFLPHHTPQRFTPPHPLRRRLCSAPACLALSPPCAMPHGLCISPGSPTLTSPSCWHPRRATEPTFHPLPSQQVPLPSLSPLPVPIPAPRLPPPALVAPCRPPPGSASAGSA